MGEVAFKLFSSRVAFGGKKAVYVGCATAHNGSNPNAMGMQAQPSQAKVLVGP